MNPTLRNILAVVAGIGVGMTVNMGLVILGSKMIPAPPGIDITNPDSIAANVHLFELKHYVFPFLAHAVGTLAGAYTAARIAVSQKLRFGLGMGLFFLIGGIANAMMIGFPLWFAAFDLILAYVPMGYLGARIASKA